MHHKYMKSGNHSMENQNIVCHVFSFCSLLLALFENQGIIISMITPSMKLSQLEMALGMETLAPGLLIFCFLIDCQILQGFQFLKK